MAELFFPGKEVGIVYNPVSGTKPVSVNDAIAARVAERFEKHGWNVELFRTTAERGSGAKLARKAGSKYGKVISLGGDGLRLDVATGLLHTEIPLGHLPNGTVDVWAKETHMPKDSLKAVDTLVTGTYHTVDTGTLNGDPFLLMAGFGMDAKVIHKAHPPGQGKKKKGLGPYLRHTLTTVPYFEGIPAEYRIGTESEEIKFLQGWVHNTEKLSHLRIRSSKADDNEHEITLYTGERGYQMLPHFFSGAFLFSTERPRTRYRHGTEFTLCLMRPVAVELDGEPRPESAYIHSKVVPSSLVVWTPDKKASIFTQ